MKKILLGLLCVSLLSWGAVGLFAETKEAPAAPDAAKLAKTLDCLQKAYNGESNATEKYAAFATKADEEGFHQVASLFRAASKAEKFHVGNHAQVIEKLGAKPIATIEKFEVKTTKENLEAAIKGETYEKDTMYPDFIKIAEGEKSADAGQTFNFALMAETEHAKLYTDALANMDKMKDGKKDYFVCSTCGFTTVDLAVKACPVCATPFADELKVN